MTTWGNKPVKRMEVGLVMNRTTVFPSLDLILPIGKHAEVLIYFSYSTHLGWFASITQKKKLLATWKEFSKKVWHCSQKEKLCEAAGRLLCHQAFVLSCQKIKEKLLC